VISRPFLGATPTSNQHHGNPHEQRAQSGDCGCNRSDFERPKHWPDSVWNECCVGLDDHRQQLGCNASGEYLVWHGMHCHLKMTDETARKHPRDMIVAVVITPTPPRDGLRPAPQWRWQPCSYQFVCYSHSCCSRMSVILCVWQCVFAHAKSNVSSSSTDHTRPEHFAVGTREPLMRVERVSGPMSTWLQSNPSSQCIPYRPVLINVTSRLAGGMVTVSA
jgi:hypothetical protein